MYVNMNINEFFYLQMFLLHEDPEGKDVFKVCSEVKQNISIISGGKCGVPTTNKSSGLSVTESVKKLSEVE